VKILIAEDDPVSRRLLEATLRKWGYQVVVCIDGSTAWQAFQQPDAPSLAILDWMMPGMDGVQVCREVRQRPEAPYVYVILLTAKHQKADVITGLEAGADDYVVKPFDANELRMRLRAGQRILDLQDELIFAREELREQATHDSLTRLWNRAAILEILQRELDRTTRSSTTLSILLADVDHFKRVNDAYGHLAGDAVLREIARRMQTALRPYDGIGRYGGEEFLLVLPDCDSAGAVALAERLRVAVSSEAVVLAEGVIPVTLSLGIATCAGLCESKTLIAAADGALYRAKGSGRNRTELALPNDLIQPYPLPELVL
jgi:diguanylate cyclase (GGDEF)-like protein